MTNRQSGLRFDIYERVQLPEGVVSVKELEEVELVPQIQVLPHEDQAILSGNLLLTGTYVAEDETEVRQLEHTIPVEITLPMNRIHRVEDISVEIENFDIDVLTPRRLNVTGVLLLNGVEMISGNPDFFQEVREEEEIVFVHDSAVDESRQNNETQPVQQFGDVSFNSAQQVPFFQQPSPWFNNETQNLAAREDREIAVESEESQSGDVSSSYVPTQEEAFFSRQDAFVPQYQIEDPPAQAAPEDLQELRIGFGSRDNTIPVVVEERQPATVSLLHKLTSMSSADRAPKEDKAPAPSPESSLDVLEWKKLFLGGGGAPQQEFKKVRMCIVQREETIESIALRYKISPREIASYNRLDTSDVAEGQIIYIPK